MKYFILMLMFSSVMVLADKKLSKEPPVRIIDRKRFNVEDCKPDPLTPCLIETVTIQNDLLVLSMVTISCGDQYDEQSIQVPARALLKVHIELTFPPTKEEWCKIVGHYE